MPQRHPLARVAACASLFLTTGLRADDWPEWRGEGRLGVWTESGIIERFPDDGLEVVWRAPIRGGYASPAVAAGRVFVRNDREIIRVSLAADDYQ